jgi:hypothetical protein
VLRSKCVMRPAQPSASCQTIQWARSESTATSSILGSQRQPLQGAVSIQCAVGVSTLFWRIVRGTKRLAVGMM